MSYASDLIRRGIATRDHIADLLENVLRENGVAVAELNGAIDASRLDDGFFEQMVRQFQSMHGLVADGVIGPNTTAAVEALQPALWAPTANAPASTGKRSSKRATTFDSAAQTAPTPRVTRGEDSRIAEPAIELPLWKNPLMDAYPRSERQDVLDRVYGQVLRDGAIEANPTWVQRHIVVARNLPGVDPKRYIQVHRLVEPAMREGLTRALAAAPGFRIVNLGTWVVRRKQHNPKLPPSTHSWGISFDVNTRTNRDVRFPYHDRATGKRWQKCPDVYSPDYLLIWPDVVPRAFVKAIASCGWKWGRRFSDRYADPMHFQYVGLPKRMYP